jgi:hypothetical protein
MTEAQLKDGMFVSWEEWGHTATALITSAKTGWFDAAINLWRDGQMGEIDADGYPSRVWWGDYIDGNDEGTLRPANKKEVQKYMKMVGFNVNGRENIFDALLYNYIDGCYYGVNMKNSIINGKRKN